MKKTSEFIEKMKQLLNDAEKINDTGDWYELGDKIGEMSDLYNDARYRGCCFPDRY